MHQMWIPVHAERVEKKIPCDSCDYLFNNNSRLRSHIKSVHEGKKFTCDSCDYLLNDQANLRTCIKSVHEEKNIPCESCD